MLSAKQNQLLKSLGKNSFKVLGTTAKNMNVTTIKVGTNNLKLLDGNFFL